MKTFGVVGMSPGNSYFKEDVVEKTILRALDEFDSVGIFIPDIPAIATYLALGYPENRARRDKAIPQGNALRNKALKAIEKNRIDKNRIRIFGWKEENIEINAEYQKWLGYVEDLYNTNADFRKDSDAATAEVLTDHDLKKMEIGQEQIRIGVRYLHSELAFMLFLPEYLKQDMVMYTYHRPWPVWQNLIAGKYDGKIHSSVGFKQFSEIKTA